MKRHICIHGHFYQPPRENAWLDAVEMQDSAYPYHDWNERVTAECYAPNASARILDQQQRIEKIVNNYSRINFNFGPTLLSWLERRSPEVYAAILDADHESRLRFSGHGSAIAQAYNHMIMPLANERDRETQVIWGLRDFVSRFGREPEGMWLPETAVDVATLETFAAHGIRFTILEPHQALRYRKIGSVQWHEVNGDPLDPRRSYRANLPSGRSIDIFFYDGPISRAVAFQQLLSNGEHFANRLISALADRDEPQIVSIATDGETYGHHHHYGEMALAYALHSIENRSDVDLTNYAEYLTNHPPEYEVEIRELTSWSCSHGVERWRSNCGCSTGGEATWNQAWREPLRSALDWLRGTAVPLYEAAANEIGFDPWRARNEYIDLVLDRSRENVEDFLHRHTNRTLSHPEKVRALSLLEMQRNAMLMYTSCGWFFNELSGIETVQVMQYAGRAIQLAERAFALPLEKPFLDTLAKAQSNVPERGSGRDIYLRSVLPAMVSLPRVAAHFAVESIFTTAMPSAEVYSYEVQREDAEAVEIGRARVLFGATTVRSIMTLEEARLTYAVLYLGDVHLTGGIRDYDTNAYLALKKELSDPFAAADFTELMRLLYKHFDALTLSLKSLFRDEQRAMLSSIINTTLAEAEAALRQLHDRYLPLMRFHLDLGIPLPKVLNAVAEFDLNLLLRRAFERDDIPIDHVSSLLNRVSAERVTVDTTSLAYSLKQTLDRLARQFVETPREVTALLQLDSAVTLAKKLPFVIDLWSVQNAFYRTRHLLSAELPAGAEPVDDEEELLWRETFLALGQKLSFRETVFEDSGTAMEK